MQEIKHNLNDEGSQYTLIPSRIQKRIQGYGISLFLHEAGYNSKDGAIEISASYKAKNHYLLFGVLKGEGSYRVLDKKYLIKENYFFVLPANIIHELRSSTEHHWRIYWAYFSGNACEKIVSDVMGSYYEPTRTNPLVDTEAQLNEIFYHLELMENTENLIYANTIFYRLLFSLNVKGSPARKYSKKDFLSQSIGYMRENLNGMVKLESLAEMDGMSVSHYCSVFKRSTMMTPLQLFTSMKIQRACYLLKYQEQSIKSIANDLGFFDQYHFSKVFKRIIGLAPRHFRNSLTGKVNRSTNSAFGLDERI